MGLVVIKPILRRFENRYDSRTHIQLPRTWPSGTASALIATITFLALLSQDVASRFQSTRDTVWLLRSPSTSPGRSAKEIQVLGELHSHGKDVPPL